MRVTTVANQGLPRTFMAPCLESMARASLELAKNSEKDVRAMRATASREVRQRAETFICMNTVATVPSTPKAVMPLATPRAKTWKAVPVSAPSAPRVLTVDHMMPAMTMARMPTKDSRTMAP